MIGGVGVVGAELGDHGEGAGEGGAGGEAAEPRGLDGRAVGHGVGEGHADLDEVGAGGGHAAQDFHAGGGVGVVGFEEGDEGASALLLQGGEAGGDAAHGFEPESPLPPAGEGWVRVLPRAGMSNRQEGPSPRPSPVKNGSGRRSAVTA